MHHAVHDSRGSPYTFLGKEGTQSLISLSKSISDDIRGSDGSIYADEALFGAPPLSFVCVLIMFFLFTCPCCATGDLHNAPKNGQTSHYSHVQLA